MSSRGACSPDAARRESMPPRRQGGDSHIKGSTYQVKRALETPEALGVVRITRPTDLFVERVKGKQPPAFYRVTQPRRQRTMAGGLLIRLGAAFGSQCRIVDLSRAV